MACWNDKQEGGTLIECQICGAKLLKKRRTYHVTECYERHIHLLADMGLIKCPLNRLHVIPIVYLNHHLEGNCEEAQNNLRRYFNRCELRLADWKDPPAHFLADVPDDILHKDNKKLLYILRKDISGRDLTDNKDLYPDPPGPKSAAHAPQPAAAAAAEPTTTSQPTSTRDTPTTVQAEPPTVGQTEPTEAATQ